MLSSSRVQTNIVYLLDSDDELVFRKPPDLVSVKIQTLEEWGVAFKFPELPEMMSSNKETTGEDVATVTIVYQQFAMETILQSTGSSELSKFIASKDFRHEQVECLLSRYNGNIVFELRPPIFVLLKGSRLCDMDRSKDYYMWTQIFHTSANVQPKKCWEFGRVSCTGSIEC